MLKLTMEDFRKCFRAQFIFQKEKKGIKTGKTGWATSKGGYYTAYNHEFKRVNYGSESVDTNAIVVFLYLAPRYEFTQEEIQKELNISNKLFNSLSIEMKEMTSPNYHTYSIFKTAMVKSNLVKNCLFINHRVSATLKELDL